MQRSPAAALAIPVLGLLACTSLKQAKDSPVEGVTCTEFVAGGSDSASLARALASASPGSCVIAEATVYQGSFDVPKGVALAGSKGQRAIVQGGTPDRAAVSVSGGTGSGLLNLTIRDAAGIGIRIDGGPVVIRDVTVERATSAAMHATCTNCGSTDALTLTNVSLRESKLGAWFQGGNVRWTGGASAANTSKSLTGGVGILVTDGASFELTGVSVSDNDAVGIFVDGTGGTSATLSAVSVTNNHERGVWAQKLAGASDAPRLRVLAKSVIDGNGLVGVGVFDSTGVVLDDVSIKNTRLRATIVDLIGTENVGDGILLDTSGAVVRNVSVDNNERAAALVARPKAAVSFEQIRITGAAGGYRVVVQDRNANAVDIPDGDVVDPGKHLGLPAALSVSDLTR